jgi:hypothetical protein
MPQYWLKPIGVTQPNDLIENDWTRDLDLSSMELMTGPANHQKPPQIGRGDRVILHAVGHVRVYADVEILSNPKWVSDPVYKLRFPYVYQCRVDTWVPLVGDGPRTRDVAPKRAIGRIMAGGEYAKLSPSEYDVVLTALRTSSTARRREDDDAAA